jgi:cysteine desulfurase
MPCKGLGECDYVSGAAHKFGGPRGVGFLKMPHRSHITPLLLGGKQEGGRRAGTENVAIIAAMLAALEVREKQMARSEHCCAASGATILSAQLLQTCPAQHCRRAIQPRLWNTVSALMPEGDRKRNGSPKLDKAGFAVSTGSACTTGKEEPSHVLAAMHFKARKRTAWCASAAAGKRPKPTGTRWPALAKIHAERANTSRTMARAPLMLVP